MPAHKNKEARADGRTRTDEQIKGFGQQGRRREEAGKVGGTGRREEKREEGKSEGGGRNR